MATSSATWPASGSQDAIAAFSIEIVDSIERLTSLRADWDALLIRSSHASVFMSWEWQTLWWKHYGGDQPLRVLVARHGLRVVGILPLYVQHRRLLGMLPLRVLRNVGTGGDTAPDDLDPLISPEVQEEAARGLAQYIANNLRGWDVARISDLAPGSFFAQHLADACAKRGWRVVAGVCARISVAPLPRSWDDYLAEHSRDRRFTIRSTRRKFLALPGARFVVWNERSTLERGIDRLIALHRLRWQARDEQHAFSSDAYVGFHREVMHALFERGMLRLYGLEVEGEVISVLYCYRFRDAVYYFQGGFDPALSKLSPGLVLIGFAIENALLEGCKAFDMLRGEYEYKTQWARDRRETRQIELFPKRLFPLLYRMRQELLPRLKDSLASLARPGRSAPK